MADFFLWDYLRQCGKPVVMFGTGDGADKILTVAARYGVKPACFAVSGDFGVKPEFRGYRVLRFEQAAAEFPGMIVLLCFGSHNPEMLARFAEISAKHEFYAPDVPVCADDCDSFAVYTPEYVEENRENLEKTRKMFADEESREVFDGWLEYRLSGKIAALERISCDRAEILGLMRFKSDEFFVDAGAFKGDTIDEFMGLVGQKEDYESPRFRKIIAIEPDIRNYTYLRRRFYAYGSGIFVPVNAAAWDCEESVPFTAKTGRGGGVSPPAIPPTAGVSSGFTNSSESTGGGGFGRGRVTQVKGVTIDSLCGGKDDKPTYLKFDVEGAESRALAGAKSVIARHRPKLLVSLYHRTEDMFTLPLQVQSYCSRYKFYLRKTRAVPGWEFQLIAVV